MTMQRDDGVTTTGAVTPSEPQQPPQGGASPEDSQPDIREKLVAAKDEGGQVAQLGVEAGKEVVHQAAEQASILATEAKDQLGSMLGQVKDEFASQAEARGQQVADGLRTLSTQLSALSQGRPEDAGRVGAIVDEAQHRLQSYADTLQDRGPQAVVEDLSGFARRRPAVFLLAAAASGFAIGRLVRGGAAANKQEAEREQTAVEWRRPNELAAQI